MNENMTLYEKVRSVPKEAIKAIGGGRLKGMSDINPMWRIKMLTEVFGICGIGWKIEVTDKRLENGSANEIVCFVDILLYVKVESEWSAPIPGMGGSSFVTLENSGKLYTSDECFKMAYTDAISVACKSLGFAADVYFANDRTKYTNQEETKQGTPADDSLVNVSDDDLNALSKASEEFVNTPVTPKKETLPTTGNVLNDALQNTAGTSNLISEAQVKYSHKLRHDKKINEDDFKRMIAENSEGNVEIKQLTKKQASAFINFLTAYSVQESA